VILDPQLVARINSGRCLALVGSGPSCQLGYPSWHSLADRVFQALKDAGRIDDEASYNQYRTNRRYPELFRQAEYDAGGRKNLVQLVQGLLVRPPSTAGDAILYDILVDWPFACYLTTNYDDELIARLAAAGHHFTLLRNRREDFYALRDSASHLVVKLHSDLSHPEEVVLTSEDYHKLSFDPTYEYFRERLRSVFQMFDVCVIGHSMSDPDLQLILQVAKQNAATNRPVYMIVANLQRAEQREYSEKYNISAITYGDVDGSHAQLRRLLLTADRYVVKRNERSDSLPPESGIDVEVASSLLLFRRLQTYRLQASTTATEYLAPLVLYSLGSAGASELTISELTATAPFASLAKGTSKDNLTAVLTSVVNDLKTQKLVMGIDTFSLTPAGAERVAEVTSLRSIERDQALGQFALSLALIMPAIDANQQQLAKDVLESTLVDIFRKRGLAIASSLFADHRVEADDLSELFSAVYQSSAALPEGDVRAAFAEAAYDFIVTPTTPQKRYLSSLSQGFFLYHMAGLDPSCANIRRDVFQHTVWLFDSSVLLPLLAVGCHNHAFAVDLFTRLRNAHAPVFVTRRMLDEAWEHYQWAVRFIRKNPAATPSFVAAVLVEAGYRQNLFLDGFVRASADGVVNRFEDYLDRVSPGAVTEANFAKMLTAHGLRITDTPVITGFTPEDWADVDSLVEMIRDERLRTDIYKSDDQVRAEAEVLNIIDNLRRQRYTLPAVNDFEKAYFVSQSRVLDRVSSFDNLVTWSPEALYRYLTTLPGENTDPELLQQCMLQEYYYAGVSFIDKPRYLKFFGPIIHQSRILYEEQKNKLIQEIEQHTLLDLDQAFDGTPDLEKPLFVSRLVTRNVEAAERVAREATARAELAEIRVKTLEGEKARKARKVSRRRGQQAAAEAQHRTDLARQRKKHRQQKKKNRKKRK
jgi:SIR2-like protein